jgi:Ca2+-binding EF-hand superfamily protein
LFLHFSLKNRLRALRVRSQGHISKEAFVHGLGEIDPEVDEAAKGAAQKAGRARRKALAAVSTIDALEGDPGGSDGGPAVPAVELHDAWLELCKYFGKGKARALATFKAIDTDGGGTLDRAEFRVFVAMLNLKLSDLELAALWQELDADGSGAVSFLELQTAVNDREREAGVEKAASDAANARAEKALKASASVSAAVVKTAECWEQIGDFLERQGEEASRRYFMGYDSTGHGTLSKEEFFNALLAGPKVELEDPALFELLWQDVDLTGHNEVEFDEIWTNVLENKLRAEQVMTGVWLPTAKDKQKELIKLDTARRKAKEAAAQTKDEVTRVKKEFVEVKRGKLAKASGNEQIKLKAMQMRARRKALAVEQGRRRVDLGFVPFDKLRLGAYAVLVAAAVSYAVQTQVAFQLQGTDDFMVLSSGLLAAAALCGVATSLLQHWASLLLFFALTVWALLAVALQLAANLNTWHFLAHVAGSCYSPRDTPNSQNFCFDADGKSDAACVCTDTATGQCYEFTPGVSSSGCNPKADATSYLLLATVVGGLAFASAVAMWATVGCTAPLRGRPFGYYYLFCARRKLAAALLQRRKNQKDSFGSALKDYHKMKSQKKAQKGFEVLVESLAAAARDGGGDVGVFKRMDAGGGGKLDQLAFRGGLQALGVKAAPADLAKLWDFMDSDHSGAITFPDFATGLKVAARSLGSASVAGDGSGGADLEAGGGGNVTELLDAKARLKEVSQAAWNKLHAVLERFQLPPHQFFAKKLDVDEAGDLDAADFEEALLGLGLVMAGDEVSQLWKTILVPPSDLINADDFAAAVVKYPPS